MSMSINHFPKTTIASGLCNEKFLTDGFTFGNLTCLYLCVTSYIHDDPSFILLCPPGTRDTVLVPLQSVFQIWSTVTCIYLIDPVAGHVQQCFFLYPSYSSYVLLRTQPHGTQSPPSILPFLLQDIAYTN
jgi:hypothetical protein